MLKNVMLKNKIITHSLCTIFFVAAPLAVAVTPGHAWNVKTIDYETNRNSTNLADGVYMDQGAWKTSKWPAAANGSYRYLSVSVDPQRHGIAFWSVQIPKTGFYKIETTYLQGENRGYDANYAVYVNKTTDAALAYTAKPVYSTIINQHAEALANPWPSLGTYCLQANDISMVVLDGRDDSLSDAADATRWTYMGETYNSQRCGGANITPLIHTLLLKK